MATTTDPVMLAISRYVRPHMVSFDIGANTGRMSAIMSVFAREVYAFEPIPELAAGIEAKKLPKVKVINTAMSDKEGEATFHLDDRPGIEMQASSLRGDLAVSTRSITVPVTTIDSFAKRTGVLPDFMKIDVEGCDELVIRGGMVTIRNYRPVFMFEVWGHNWPRFEAVVRDLSDLYRFERASTRADAVAEYGAGLVTENDDVIAIPR